MASNTEILESVAKFEKTLTEVKAQLSPLFETDLEQLLENLAPIDRAKLEVTIGYAVASLFYVYLRTQGLSPNEHPIRQELERVSLYLQKLRQHETKEKDNARSELATRFVKNALFDPSKVKPAKSKGSSVTSEPVEITTPQTPTTTKRSKRTAAVEVDKEQDEDVVAEASAVAEEEQAQPPAKKSKHKRSKSSVN